ncbi:Tnpo1 [Symbiodinium sp. KB8]|nr:Tnpo1 [Symbiodinium sp. KB8]
MKLPAGLPVNWSAVWALGELCQKVDPLSLEPAIPQITEAFVGIFQRRVGMEVLPNQLAAHRQLLRESCITVTCLKHTSTLGDRWPSCKRLIPEENLKQLQSQYGFCD